MNNDIYCGVDGGGTKSIVKCTDADGRTLAIAEFGAMNLNGSNVENCSQVISDILNFCRDKAATLSKQIAVLVIGAAGISNPDAVAIIEAAADQYGYLGKLILVNDCEIALQSAVGDEGIILIAGTGSVCAGRVAGGPMLRVGGYGHIFDDDGSSYALATEAFRAVVRAEDGRGAPTLLSRLVFDRLQGNTTDLIRFCYSPYTTKRDIAAFAPLLQQAIKAGDQVALDIEHQAAAELCLMAKTMIRRLGLVQPKVALAGGVLKNFSSLRKRLEQKLMTACPGVRIIPPGAEPVDGAIQIALKHRSV